jgi:hypothetical protein
VLREPLKGSLPFHPSEAVQAVAWVDDQFKVDVPPFATVLGVAVSVTVGAAAVTVTVADWAAVPPGPEQDKL